MPSPTNEKTSISNLGLSHIKQRTITSFDEQSEQARKCQLFWDRARRAALRACDWNFTTKNQRLDLLGSVADANFDATFAIPQDIVPGWHSLYAMPPKCQRVRRIYTIQVPGVFNAFIDNTFRDRAADDDTGDEVKFKVLRSPKTDVMAIACNVQGAWAEFTFDVTDESQFDDMFVEAMGFEMALRLCMPLTADMELLAAIAAQYKEFVGEAKRKNGGEGTEMLRRVSAYERARD